MPSKPSTLLSWDQSEEDEPVQRGAGKSSKVSFKRRAPKSTGSGIAKKSKTEHPLEIPQEEEEEEEEAVLVKSAVKSSSKRGIYKFVSRGAKPGANETVSTDSPTYTADYLDSLKDAVDNPLSSVDSLKQVAENAGVVSAENVGRTDADITAAPEYISINLESESEEEGNEAGFDPSLELDEGLGFEDDVLPLDKRSKRLQDQQHKQDMKTAIDEYSNEDDDDIQWTASQINRANGNSSSHSMQIKEIAEMPRVLQGISALLQARRNNKQQILDQISALTNEIDLISEKQEIVQTGLEKAAKESSENAEKLQSRALSNPA